MTETDKLKLLVVELLRQNITLHNDLCEAKLSTSQHIILHNSQAQPPQIG